MNRKIFLIAIILFSFVLASHVSLTKTSETYAHPAFNLTPEPEPEPTDDSDDSDDSGDTDSGGDSSDSDDGDDDDDDGPENSAEVFFDCDCFDGEMQANAQLIHDGSNWIAEGRLSSAKATRFMLPYDGNWNVFMTSAPEFSAEADVSALNLDDIHTNLATAPISVGMVQANAMVPQAVSCSVICGESGAVPAVPTETAEEEELPPSLLPETGKANEVTAIWLLIAGLLTGLLSFVCGVYLKKSQVLF